ncbi:MAG: hypothetical protein RL226_662 [Bacteroidota bacterium]
MSALVVGDVMIDAYYWGKVERISPEAPVPVVQISNRENRLGGAANVALNIWALGATPVICSVIGADEKARLMRELMAEKQFTAEGLIESNERVTTVKTRVISGAHHLLRVDEETTTPLTSAEENALIERCQTFIASGNIQVVIFEDYNKGVLTERVIRSVIEIARQHGIPTTVDPKKDNFFAYQQVDLFKPNLKELKEGINMPVDRKDLTTIHAAIDAMEKRLNNVISLVTLSEQGVLIQAGEQRIHIPAHPREILDVSGAGDTVISVASLLLAAQADIRTIATVANLSGGLVCEKVGVVPVDKMRLLEEATKLMNS